MNLKSLVIAFMMLNIMCRSFGQVIRPEPSINPFFKSLKKEGLARATDKLIKDFNPIIKGELKIKLENEFNKIDTSYIYDDWAFICDRTLSLDLVFESYLVKYGNMPYRFDVLFYRKGDKWYIQDLSISVNLFEDLKNAVRVEKPKGN